MSDTDTARPANPLGYGTPDHLTSMLDAVHESVREEPQEQWDDPDVRAASEALADHLTARNQRWAQQRSRHMEMTQ